MLLNQWRKTESADVFVTDGETVSQYRFTFVTMSAFEETRYNALRRGAVAALSEMFDGLDNIEPEQTPEVNDYFVLLIKASATLATCTTLQVRSYPESMPAEDREQVALETVPMPKEWRTAKGLAQAVPLHTIDYLYDTVLMAGNSNRLFGFTPVSDEEKKMIRINDKPSEN